MELLTVSQSKGPPYWNSTSDFSSAMFIAIYMSLHNGLQDFVVIRRSATELWHHIDYSRWRPENHKSTSDFGFNDAGWKKKDSTWDKLTVKKSQSGYISPIWTETFARPLCLSRRIRPPPSGNGPRRRRKKNRRAAEPAVIYGCCVSF